MTIESLQPYLSLVNTVISLTVLGIIFNLIKTHRETVTERINALKDRLDGSKEDSERKDQWYTREKEQLEKEKQEKESELAKLKTQLDEILKEEGISFQNLALGQSLKQSTNEVKVLIEDLTSKMANQLESISASKTPNDLVISESQLTIAKAQMAKGNFSAAAHSFDEYTSSKQTSWEIYFSKAVNLANLRQGEETNLGSVKAYSDAINSLPANIEPNMKARLFGYRGAILKRLNRLDEAEADLNIAIKYASGNYEIDDINYNLTCIYALQANKEKMLTYMAKITSRQRLLAIQSHLSDYFKHFASDIEFRNLFKSKFSG